MDRDRFFRRLTQASIGLLVVGAILFVSGLAMPLTIPSFLVVVGVLALLAALTMRIVVLLDRIWNAAMGRPPRGRSALSPPGYACHKCGYKLRGVKGTCCPECGTVRPAPVHGDESA